MKIDIRITDVAKKQIKHFSKKYLSIFSDLEILKEELLKNPYLGTEVIPNVYKIRMAIKSKGKGKSGGARVINYHTETEIIVTKNEIDSDAKNELIHTINIISIYDKSEVENITNTEIKNLIENID